MSPYAFVVDLLDLGFLGGRERDGVAQVVFFGRLGRWIGGC